MKDSQHGVDTIQGRPKYIKANNERFSTRPGVVGENG